MQNGNAQNVTEPDFRKKIFSGRKCRKYAGKTGFLAFSRDFIIIVFTDFFAQRCILIMPKIWPSLIFRKIFFRSKIPEICRKSPFLLIFIGLFPYISLFFHTKIIVISRFFIRSFVRSLYIFYTPGFPFLRISSTHSGWYRNSIRSLSSEWIFFGLFPHISLFFHTKTLVISLFRSFVRSLARFFVLSLSGRSNQH